MSASDQSEMAAYEPCRRMCGQVPNIWYCQRQHGHEGQHSPDREPSSAARDEGRVYVTCPACRVRLRHSQENQARYCPECGAPLPEPCICAPDGAPCLGDTGRCPACVARFDRDPDAYCLNDPEVTTSA